MARAERQDRKRNLTKTGSELRENSRSQSFRGNAFQDETGSFTNTSGVSAYDKVKRRHTRHGKKKCRCLTRERQTETEQGSSPCPPHLPRLTSRRELLSSFCCPFLKAVVLNLSQLCTVRWWRTLSCPPSQLCQLKKKVFTMLRLISSWSTKLLNLSQFTYRLLPRRTNRLYLQHSHCINGMPENTKWCIWLHDPTLPEFRKQGSSFFFLSEHSRPLNSASAFIRSCCSVLKYHLERPFSHRAALLTNRPESVHPGEWLC